MPKKKISLPQADASKVLTKAQGVKGFTLKLGGEPITPDQLSQLKGEAAQFQQMLLRQVLIETLKFEAQEIIFHTSKDFQDVLNGKNILHTVETQENILKLLE